MASELIHYLQYNSELPAPHHISKLPPIDSDLYTQPSDSLSHLNFDSYSLPGQFVRPRPNKFQTNFNNQNYYQSSTTNHNQSVNQAASLISRPTPTHSATHEIIPDQEISYPTTTTTENQYKTDFGYKVVPKPTEAVKIIPAPVTEPVRPFIPIFESYSRFVIVCTSIFLYYFAT